MSVAKPVLLATVYFASAALAVCFAKRALAQTSTSARQQLEQYVAQLQNDSNNTALREKIVRLALTIQPPLTIPDKDHVLELLGQGKAALKSASTDDDYSGAVKIFKKAMLVAPWDANLNYDLAKAQELAKQYNDGSVSYKLYLLAAPDAKDHDTVVEKIGELEYKAKENSPEAIAERNLRAAQEAETKKEQEQVDFITSLDGAVFEGVKQDSSGTQTETFVIRGQQVSYTLDLCCGQGGPNWYGHAGAPGHWILIERAFPIEGKGFFLEGREIQCRRPGTITANSITVTWEGCPNNLSSLSPTVALRKR